VTIFELIKIALDELYKEGELVYGRGLDAKIVSRLQYLLRNYRGLNSSNYSPWVTAAAIAV
jgi:hypothetical protein